MNLIDGKLISEQIKEEIKKEVAAMIDRGERAPHLAAVLVGEDPASQTYVASKEKNCTSVGITSTIYRMEENTTEKQLMDVIEFLNNDPEVDGFIVQLPLPKHLDENKVIAAINPEKDVDGFHPENLGKMVLGQDTFISATPFGIMEMLRRCQIETVGKHCVVIGRSNIVGTPMSILMSRTTNPGNSTVTLCHSKTQNLKEIAASADILIVAIGKPNFVTADMVKPGAVVVDAGTAAEHGKVVGDVAADVRELDDITITPITGGVGPLTVAALFDNVIQAARAVADAQGQQDLN